MKEEEVEGWIKVYETFDAIVSGMTEAKLSDAGIEYQIINQGSSGLAVYVGNSEMGRESIGLPFKFFVKPEDSEKATALLSEDNSKLLDDPNIEFDSIEDKP